MEPIKIFKGNDTNFNDGKFLTFTVTGDIDLSDFSGIFTLGSFSKPGSLADGKMEVVMPAAVTAQFPLGAMCGTFQLVDNKMRVATVTNTIPFLITSEVFTPTPDVVELETPEGYPVNVNMQIGFASGNYNDLNNLPQIDGVTLDGNKTAAELGLATPTDLQPITQDVAQLQSDVAGKQAALSAQQLEAANSGIDTEKVGQITQNAQNIADIEQLVPTQASANNQLADKGFVNSTVQTSTAHFRGNWETFADVPTDPSLYPADEFGVHEPGPNDYMVVRRDETEGGGTWRYKYTGLWATNGKNGWEVEYPINETPLTAAQLAALNSGVTSQTVAQVETNESDIASLKTTKQDVISDLATIRAGAAAGATALQPATAASTYIPQSQKGVAAGVATLDNTGQITDGQIPYATENKVGGIKSSFDAATGTWTVFTEDL